MTWMRARQEPVITVGVGKTHLATALGHIAIRRRLTVQMTRAEKLFTRLRAARLDNTLDAEFRRLTRLDLLIIDDFALRPLDATTTADFYELVVERHKKAATIWTSNRAPDKAHMFGRTYAQSRRNVTGSRQRLAVGCCRRGRRGRT